MEHLESSDNDDLQQTVGKPVEVSVSEKGFPQISNFSDGEFPGFIKRALKKQGYKEPTPIQSHVWPIALKGRDIVGIAQTGSGKTLAYGLPAILHVFKKEHQIRNDEPTVLVLAPTRELAQQINTVFADFLYGSSIRNVCIFGGASKGSQLYKMDQGCNILIATPGRLIDFLESNCLTLKACTFLVLDEADRMLDIGFETQIKTILKEITAVRQTLMFSATWPEEVRSLAKDYLIEYVRVNVGATQLAANHNIRQHVEVLDELEKDKKLLKLLKRIMREQENKTLIFAATKIRVSELTSILKTKGYPVISMHGDKSQSEREYALKQFRDGICSILVATDVAARGLDVDDIKFVINVDYPNTSEDYVHRIGRTARVNNSGTAYTFFTFQDMKQAQDLVDILTEAKQEINADLINLLEMSKTFGCGKGRSLGACCLGRGRYEANEPKPKKQDKYPNKDWDYRQKDQDINRSWNRDNKNLSRDNERNGDRDSYRNNPKKPRHYENTRKPVYRQNKYDSYDSSNYFWEHDKYF